MWKEILLKIIKGEEHIKSPFHKDSELEYRFVVFNKNEKIGTLYFWCPKSMKGGSFSRIGVPENSDFVLYEDLKDEIPEFELIEIDFEE